jgi:TP901 family phage tail tape measure protein
MSATLLERLRFRVSVEDSASGPVGRMSRSLQDMQRRFSQFGAGVDQGLNRMTAGAKSLAVGLVASGAGLYSFLKPVYDMQNALGEVRSLGVAEQELQRLKKAASAFSTAYGESATDFVRSSYDIQSAIAGLTQGELAKFTTASNILAKGTKADAATVTNYMGTMYGIFSKQANAMGKAQWVEQLTGQTATAVQMFKTTGNELSSAFTALGANAQAAGIGLAEQMSILGTLQATMSGSEAGTKYKAFLSGVGAAQNKLGLQFTDSQGRMLPMLDILDKLKGKFGSTLDVAESDALKKAFGSDEAVGLVKLLMNKTDGLRTSMQRLGDVRGMEQAERMAKDMIDPWARLGAVTTDLRMSFGELFLPTVNRVLGAMQNGLITLKGWIEAYPNIARWVGYAAVSMLGFAAALSLGSIALGIGQVAMAGLRLGLGLLLSPFGLVTAAIALVGFGAYQLWQHWDSLKQGFLDLSWVKSLGNMYDKVAGWFSDLTDKALGFINMLGFFDDELATQFSTQHTQTQEQRFIHSQVFQSGVSPDPFSASQFNASRFGFAVNDPLAFRLMPEQQEAPLPLGPLRLPDETPAPNKSIGAQLSQSLGNQKRCTQFGDVYIQNDQAPTPELLEEWGLLQGG